MSESPDEWRRVRLPNGASVPVRKGSPAEAAFSTQPAHSGPQSTMSWSIGLLGDFLWMNLPESRPALVKLLKKELDEAVEFNMELHRLGPLEIARDVLWYPLIEPALQADPMDAQHVAALFRIVREAWALEPVAWENPRQGLFQHVLDNLDVPRHLPVVERIDPELFALIRQEGRS